ncbi:hypothetical protein JHL21_07230 [Devosia sp. WQ 349]|uniref:hypothetical protein n=1 Tax=Devosia sp. WQ 349K1 TaxID=2800329 RepID=UPI0019082FEE|nr:hypothetical protein [Devosia sp. WQ 349K1]MBK1794291.1 hypothetical protein [Devosia sp. WQ 349K1]
MKPNLNIFAVAAALVMALFVTFGTTEDAAAQSCLDKRQIQEAVSSGQIKSLDAVLASGGVDASADILNVQVCDEGGRMVYVIAVLTSDGQAKNLVLSAQ